MKNFLESIKSRRTIYNISDEVIVSQEKIKNILEEAILNTPSAFNSQTSRVILLFGEEHKKLWKISMECLRKIVPAENFSTTEEKINSFMAGYGTVLYFEEQETIKSLQERYSLYADNFPIWSEQSSGMLQLVVWTALENEGLGASLQHYSPIINDEVYKEWNIPGNWKFIAQMPFGKPTKPADEKEFMPVNERLKVFSK